MTEWWHEKRTRKMLEAYGSDSKAASAVLSREKIESAVTRVLETAKAWHAQKEQPARTAHRSS